MTNKNKNKIVGIVATAVFHIAALILMLTLCFRTPLPLPGEAGVEVDMGMYDDASSYIQNITMVQRENISKVMNAVSEPAIAALLIGKIARASELNINFVLREGCY